jgi:hypothetical protein
VEETEPTFNRSSAPCGSIENPHVVRSATTLFCEGCRTDLSAVLLDRLTGALAPKKEDPNAGQL